VCSNTSSHKAIFSLNEIVVVRHNNLRFLASPRQPLGHNDCFFLCLANDMWASKSFSDDLPGIICSTCEMIDTPVRHKPSSTAFLYESNQPHDAPKYYRGKD